jgi:hypothetical protein
VVGVVDAVGGGEDFGDVEGRLVGAEQWLEDAAPFGQGPEQGDGGVDVRRGDEGGEVTGGAVVAGFGERSEQGDGALPVGVGGGLQAGGDDDGVAVPASARVCSALM